MCVRTRWHLRPCGDTSCQLLFNFPLDLVTSTGNPFWYSATTLRRLLRPNAPQHKGTRVALALALATFDLSGRAPSARRPRSRSRAPNPSTWTSSLALPTCALYVHCSWLPCCAPIAHVCAQATQRMLVNRMCEQPTIPTRRAVVARRDLVLVDCSSLAFDLFAAVGAIDVAHGRVEFMVAGNVWS
jgi:hypothetical protein